MNSKLLIFSIIGSVSVAVALGISILATKTITRTYSVTAAGLDMPRLDHEVEAWLKAQPGVVPDTVAVRRHANYNLNVSLQMSQSLSGKPEFPDVYSKCKEMGYKFKTDYFFNDPDY